MRINYNVTGEKRRSLVSAVSREMNAPAKYLGAPTFAYEIGACRIDKNGMLEGEDNPGLVADLQGLHSFKAVTEEYDTPLPEAEPVPDHIQIPCDAALGGRVSPYRDYEEPPAYGISETGGAARLTIEIPRSVLNDTALENLRRLAESKATLIKKALDSDALPITVSDDTVQFPWFSQGTDPEAVKAYMHFVAALCETAKTQHRVSPAEKPTGNEKYAFRCFLLRLGFIGAEYKAERRILLSKLTGNSAFRNPASRGDSDE